MVFEIQYMFQRLIGFLDENLSLSTLREMNSTYYINVRILRINYERNSNFSRHSCCENYYSTYWK